MAICVAIAYQNKDIKDVLIFKTSDYYINDPHKILNDISSKSKIPLSQWGEYQIGCHFSRIKLKIQKYLDNYFTGKNLNEP